jgi:hypothetical protein
MHESSDMSGMGTSIHSCNHTAGPAMLRTTSVRSQQLDGQPTASTRSVTGASDAVDGWRWKHAPYGSDALSRRHSWSNSIARRSLAPLPCQPPLMNGQLYERRHKHSRHVTCADLLRGPLAQRDLQKPNQTLREAPSARSSVSQWEAGEGGWNTRDGQVRLTVLTLPQSSCREHGGPSGGTARGRHGQTRQLRARWDGRAVHGRAIRSDASGPRMRRSAVGWGEIKP